MLSYLDPYFCLSRINGTAPLTGGYYLTDHPELKMDYFRSVTDEEFPSVQDVYTRILANAKREFMSDFYVNIGQFFDVVDVVEQSTVGTYLQPPVVVDQTGNNFGVLFSLFNSRWTSLYVSNIRFYLSEVGGPERFEITNVSAPIGDLLWYKEIDQADLVVGWNTVTVDQTFTIKGQIRKVLLSRTVIDTFGVSNVCYDCEAANGWWLNCACDGMYGRLFTAQGVNYDINGESYNYQYLNAQSNTGGLIADFAIVCDREQLILANLQSFLPLFYKKLVIESLKYIQATDRTNDDTLNMDRDRIKGILFGQSGQFASDRQPGLVQEYIETMAAVCKGINRTTGDICFECSDQIKMVTVLP